jgi:hypothetical protein
MMIAMTEAGGMMGVVTADPAAQRYVRRISIIYLVYQSLTIRLIFRNDTESATALVIGMHIDAEMFR